jgi:hypothetical protein
MEANVYHNATMANFQMLFHKNVWIVTLNVVFVMDLHPKNVFHVAMDSFYMKKLA